MRELHVVAVSEDGRHAILAAKRGATTGGFKVSLDGRLAAAVRGELARPGEEAVPELSPKEIQARLRNGETVEGIASSAGVPLARVERYAGPVQGEMARIIDGAQDAHLVRGRLGRSALPLGAAVDLALNNAGGLRPDSTVWSTYRLEDGSWMVSVTWYARKRSRSASWRYEPGKKQITASDTTSAQLGHVDSDAPIPVRRRTAPATPAPAKAAAPPRKPAAKKPAKKAPAKKAPAKKAPAKKAPAKKAPAKKAPAKKAPAKKVPAKKAPAKKAPAKKAPAKKAPAKKAPAKRAPQRALRVVPDPPARSSRGAAKAPAKGRASVPAWADVLLGTSPGGDR